VTTLIEPCDLADAVEDLDGHSKVRKRGVVRRPVFDPVNLRRHHRSPRPPPRARVIMGIVMAATAPKPRGSLRRPLVATPRRSHCRGFARRCPQPATHSVIRPSLRIASANDRREAPRGNGLRPRAERMDAGAPKRLIRDKKLALTGTTTEGSRCSQLRLPSTHIPSPPLIHCPSHTRGIPIHPCVPRRRCCTFGAGRPSARPVSPGNHMPGAGPLSRQRSPLLRPLRLLFGRGAA